MLNCLDKKQFINQNLCQRAEEKCEFLNLNSCLISNVVTFTMIYIES